MTAKAGCSQCISIPEHHDPALSIRDNWGDQSSLAEDAPTNSSLGPAQRTQFLSGQAPLRFKAMIRDLGVKLMIRAMQRVTRVVENGPRRPMGILKPDGLGDFVLATGAIRKLSENVPPADLTLIVAAATADFARAQFPGSRVIVLPKVRTGGMRDAFGNLLALRKTLAGLVFDQLMCLRHQRNLYEWLVFGAIRADSKVALEDDAAFLTPSQRKTWRKPHANYIAQSKVPVPEVCRELGLHATICSVVSGRNCSPRDILPKVVVSPPDKHRGLIVSPFGGHQIRTYPRNQLAVTLRSWAEHSSDEILLCGSQADGPRLTELANFLQSSGCRHIEVALFASFQGFCDRIASARCVLTMETSTAHVATALDIPMVALIGGGHFGWFAPWKSSSRQVWLSRRLECYGCNWQCPYPEPLCITEISPESVSSALKGLMTSEQPRNSPHR